MLAMMTGGFSQLENHFVGRKRLNQSPLVLSFVFLLWSSTASAQVQGDGTANTLVTSNGNTFVIDGGTSSESNLFHSFSEFSLSTGKEAFFNNLPTIDNIIARVTGGSLSDIDGLIRANGSANLFFINPNGINFGPHASLNLGGSFFASTADSIVFADGSTFSATNPQAPPLLAVNVPIGLQFRSNPGKILVQGTGHNVAAPEQLNMSFDGKSNLPSLQVKPGLTLALVGGNVSLEGGILTTDSGRIELGSVGSGFVRFNQLPQGWVLGYGDASSFQDIKLSQKALADASGSGGGSIQVQGANVSFTDGSLLFIQHQGTQIGGSISINATESLKLIGSTSSPTGLVPSALLNETIGDGNSGDIKVSTQRLLLQQGGAISAKTFRGGSSSNIIVNASESLQLIESLGKENQSIISTETYGSGKAGDLMVSTRHLTALNGGAIGSETRGTGASGHITVTASESIDLSGVVPDSELLTTVSSVTAGPGTAGTLTIYTGRLAVRDGATIAVSTYAKGDAGSLTINASESVELSGIATNLIDSNLYPSSLASAAEILPKIARERFGLPDEPIGATGNVTINTPMLSITDGAQINISHQGSKGNAGNLAINTSSVFLDSQGSITAESTSGEGGNIDINAKFLIAFPNENSDITANAFTGSGGRVEIAAQGIFGLVPRSREELQRLLGTDDANELDPRQLPSNDITAISQLNPFLSGQVTISTLDVDPSRGLIELPENIVDPAALISQNPCARGSESEFTITGRGGLPPSPNDALSSEATGVGLVEPAPMESRGALERGSRGAGEKTGSTPSTPKPIMPAQGWVFNDKGEVVLTAYNPTVTGPQRLQRNSGSCPAP